jgi:hypothetical protein
MVRFLAMLFLVGCVEESYLSFSLTACSSEVPDDGLDDTAGVQAAINARCPLAPGVYDIDMAPTPPVGRRRYSMLTVGSGKELSGAGAILRFRGNAGLQDWRGVEMTGAAPSVHDIRFETPDLVGTVEQTHAIRITGPSSSPSVHDVDFDHPYRGLDGGDCIQAVGYLPTPITDLYVGHITGDCDRSAVAMHSGVDGAVVEYVTAAAGDQIVDGEGSGEGSRNWLITHNTFGTRPSDQGAFGLQLQLTDHVRVTDNVFDGRGIVVYSGTDIEIDDVDITRRAASGEAAIEIIKEATNVRIHSVRVERTASAGAGSVIRVTPHGTGFASDVSIGPAAVLVQRAGGNVIDTSGLVGLDVDRVTIAYLGPTNGAYGVSALGAVAKQTTGLAIQDSVFSGPLAAFARISGSYAGTGTLASTRNIAIGATQGLRCENAAGIVGPVTSTGDTMPGGCSVAVTTP